MGYAVISWVMEAFLGHEKQCIQKTEVFTAVLPHAELLPTASPVAAERCAGTRGSPHRCTQFFKEPAGHLKVFSPFSVAELLRDHSLPPVPAACPHQKISMWSVVALTVAGWLEEHYYAKYGKDVQQGHTMGAT